MREERYRNDIRNPIVEDEPEIDGEMIDQAAVHSCLDSRINFE
jgi:hypothetical protein